MRKIREGDKFLIELKVNESQRITHLTAYSSNCIEVLDENLPLNQPVAITLNSGSSALIGKVQSSKLIGLNEDAICKLCGIFSLPMPRVEFDRMEQLGMAKEDRKAVDAELISIQNCRSNIFLASFSVITAINAATWAAASRFVDIQKNQFEPGLHSVGIWLMISFGITTAIFTVSIALMIEKARAINSRRAYLAVLSEFIVSNKVPLRYNGWANLRSVGTSGPPLKHTLKELLAKLFAFPYDSFTSFTGFLYTAFYGASMLGFLLSWISYFGNFEMLRKGFIVGVLLAFLVGAPAFLLYYLKLGARKAAVALAIGIPILMLGLIGFFALFATSTPNMNGASVAWIAGTTILFLGVAVHFLVEYGKIRIHKHSVESLELSWRKMLTDMN